MRKLIIMVAILSSVACSKKEAMDSVTSNPSDKFIGVWKSENFGGNSFEIVLQKLDEGTLLLSGQITAKINGYTFKSDPVNTVTHSGVLANGVLNYCQTIGGTSVCGDFRK